MLHNGGQPAVGNPEHSIPPEQTFAWIASGQQPEKEEAGPMPKMSPECK